MKNGVSYSYRRWIMMKYFAVLFVAVCFFDLAAWNNNYQRNRGKADENGNLYTMECLLCANEYVTPCA